MKNNNSRQESTVKQFAKNYIQKGWKPIPVEPGEKACKKSGWKHLRITEDTIDQHFRENNNIGVLLGGVSGDLVDIDLDCPEAIAAGSVLLPRTNAVFGRESARRSHYLYTSIEPMQYQKFNCPGHGTLVEIRTCGDDATHFTVFPPSYRADINETVSWEGDGDLDPAVIHPEMLERKVGHCAAATMLARFWPIGNRHKAALAVSGYLLKGGIPEPEVELILRAVCKAAHDEEVEDRLQCLKDTVQKLFRGEKVEGRQGLVDFLDSKQLKLLDEWLGIQVSSEHPHGSNGSASSGYENTDTGNARRLVDRYLKAIRYASDAIGWLVYDGKRWQAKTDHKIQEMAKVMVEEMVKDALQQTSGAEMKAAMNWGMSSQGSSRISALIELAKSDPKIRVEPLDLDNNAWHLNCSNGILDLKSRQLLPHDSSELITKIVPTPYTPDASCPRFLAFLETIFQADVDLIRFVQKVFGASLLGENPTQQFFILHGDGANGKSVLVNTLLDTIGRDYAGQMSPSCLVEQPGASNKQADLASLRGLRFVAASETNDSNTLDEALLKQLTGGDLITARQLYRDPIQYKPDMTIFLSTNHLPYIKDQGNSVWRRLVVIPFLVTAVLNDSPSRW